MEVPRTCARVAVTLNKLVRCSNNLAAFVNRRPKATQTLIQENVESRFSVFEDSRQMCLAPRIGDSAINRTDRVNRSGINVQENLKWDARVKASCGAFTTKLQRLCQLSRDIPGSDWLTVYLQHVRPTMEYASSARLCGSTEVQRGCLGGNSNGKRFVTIVQPPTSHVEIGFPQLWNDKLKHPDVLSTI